MLRVGLTGSLGSGKSTVAAFLRQMGADVIESDELGRALMEPGQPAFSEIVRLFGPEVVGPDGRLNRARLADLAFKEGRLQDLNAIVHPAVISAQGRWMSDLFARNAAAVAVVESALIFEVERDARARSDRNGELDDWRRAFDCIVVVTAPDELKIARYAARICPGGVGREAAEADARLRLARQIPDAEKAARADYVIDNTNDLSELQARTSALWLKLRQQSNRLLETGSLE